MVNIMLSGRQEPKERLSANSNATGNTFFYVFNNAVNS